jgi:hypothetical protein
MRRDGWTRTQFPIFRKRNFWAWSTGKSNRIESLEEIPIHAQAIWQRKSLGSGAMVGKIEQILPVGQISSGKSAYSSKQLGLVQNLMVMFEMNGRWREASPI